MCANLVKIILTPIMCYTLSGPNTFAVDPSRRTKLCWTRDPTRNAHQTIVRCIESMFHGGGSYNRRNRSGIDALQTSMCKCMSDLKLSDAHVGDNYICGYDYVYIYICVCVYMYINHMTK